MKIPNFIDSQVIDPKTGFLTPSWKTILQQLIQELITNTSDDQGLVVPSQTNVAPNFNVTTIQNSKTFDPTNPAGRFITPFGTLLYNSTTNELLVALNNAGAPVFHTIVTI